MVTVVTRYYCDKCRKGFGQSRDAEKCELDHIVKASVDGFSDKLQRILSTPKAAGEGHE